jgi:hypothetical protein
VWRLLLLLVVLALGACGPVEPRETGSAPATRSEPPAALSELYEANGTVLENRGGEVGAAHGPALCVGMVLTSLPPQCGDVPITNWDWNAVSGEERRAGVIWGDYHVVGTYDGKRFTVTKVGPVERTEYVDDDPRNELPCPEPAGGWDMSDPEAIDQGQTDAFFSYAQRQAEYVDGWVHQLLGPEELEGHEEDELPVVPVAIFTGDSERHEAELRKRWPGDLCVVERDVRPYKELVKIRAKAEGDLERMGLQMLTSAGGSLGTAAEIEVVLDRGGKGQAEFDRRYGPGMIKLTSALQPVG